MLRRFAPRMARLALTEIGIKNFKAFGNEFQSAPMSRITLIYGPNSGGKSSVIQAILLLKQSEGNLPRPAVLSPQGEYVDLAGFRALVHKHDENQEVEIRIALSDIGTSSDEEVTFDLTFGRDEKFRTDLPALKMAGYELRHDGTADLAIQLKLDPEQPPQSEEIASFSWVDQESSVRSFGEFLRKQIVDRGNRPRYFARHINQLRLSRLASYTTTDGPLSEEMLRILRDLKFHARSSVLPLNLDVAETGDHSESREMRDYYSLSLDVMDIFSNGFASFLESMSYLGPTLDDPRRFYLSWGGRRSSVGKRGEFTFDIISNDESVRQEVNGWFRKFDIPYQIRDVRSVAASELTGTLSAMALEDIRTETVVTPVDVGYGISQILPVIVEGVAGRSRIICVDQPEVHLHPKLQAEIADLMIESRSKQWIVETHSELLVRRILRRIAEKKIKPSDVSVLYVDPPSASNSERGSEIKVLEIEESGRFSSSTPWPQGFFEDGYQEMMATIQAGE